MNGETLSGSAEWSVHFQLCENLENCRENRVPEPTTYCWFLCHMRLLMSFLINHSAIKSVIIVCSQTRFISRFCY